MFGTVKIGNKDVEMLATASTPIRYKQVFKRDFVAIITNGKSNELVDFAVELAFVMAKQAEGADMTRLNVNSFYEWLDQFGGMDVYNASDEIWELFNGTQEASVDPK